MAWDVAKAWCSVFPVCPRIHMPGAVLLALVTYAAMCGFDESWRQSMCRMHIGWWYAGCRAFVSAAHARDTQSHKVLVVGYRAAACWQHAGRGQAPRAPCARIGQAGCSQTRRRGVG